MLVAVGATDGKPSVQPMESYGAQIILIAVDSQILISAIKNAVIKNQTNLRICNQCIFLIAVGYLYQPGNNDLSMCGIMRNAFL
jgi:hypothetical protein